MEENALQEFFDRAETLNLIRADEGLWVEKCTNEAEVSELDWVHGCCLVAADAIKEWLGKGAEICLAWEEEESDPEWEKPKAAWMPKTIGDEVYDYYPFHAMVRYGDRYIDAEGWWDKEEAIKRVAKMRGDFVGFMPDMFDKGTRQDAIKRNHFGYNADISHELARRLRDEFVELPWETVGQKESLEIGL